MDAKELKKVPAETLVKAYLTKKAQMKAIEKELAEIKAQIDAQANGNLLLFDDNGEWPLQSGIIKSVLNPPRMVTVAGVALTAKDRARISGLVDVKYVVSDLDVKLVQQSWEHDKALKRVLAAEKVKVEQETRYDVKAHK